MLSRHLFIFVLIRWELHRHIFKKILSKSQIDWPIPKISETLSTPQHRSLDIFHFDTPFTYMKNNYGQPIIWDKIEVLLGSSWGNSRGTWLKHTMGTYKKNKIPPSPSKPKRKRLSTPKCMLSFFIAYMKFLFPKLLVAIFNLG
jgi:hypothetical protein